MLHVLDAAKSEHANLQNEFSQPVIVVRNKIDLVNEQPSIQTEHGKTIISLSAKQNVGMHLLKQHIQQHVGFHAEEDGIYLARRRHLDALERAGIFLESSLQQLSDRAGELAADDLRQAHLALCEITGEFTSDDLLGRIFSSFCIGK